MLKRIKDCFLNIKFRNKMMVSYLLMALIPFAIFTGITISVFLSQARVTAVEHAAQMVAQVSNSIDVYISTIEESTNYIVESLSRSGLLAAGTADWDAQKESVQHLMEDMAASHPEIAGILIADREDRYIATRMSRISRDPFVEESWYRQAAEHPDRMVLLSNAAGRNIVTDEEYSIDDVFSLAKAIRSPADGKVYGVVLLDVRHNIIKESINHITIGKNGFVFVLDADGHMVYTPSNNIVYRISPAWLLPESNNTSTAHIAGGRYQLLNQQSAYTGWKTVGVFSIDEIMRGVNALSYVLVFCTVLTLLLMLLISVVLARTVTKPITKLEKLMKKAESGDLTVRFNSKYEDEIGHLGLSFNHMIDHMDELIHMVLKEQQSKRDAELKMLQEQIKPHFLYNTLDTIGWMARDYKADDIVRLVDALTGMFRIGLSHGKDYITVEEEVRHVSNYLYIQKIRYKDKLQYHVQLQEGLSRVQVPKLILQPLVENAIYHGIKQKPGGGTILLDIRVGEDGKLRMKVADDGVGMDVQVLQKLQSELRLDVSAPEKQGFGLFYIQQRILLSYGEGYGVQVESTHGEGTAVCLTLPMKP